MSGSTAAYAACSAIGAPGTYECSGKITTIQKLSPPAGQPLAVSTTARTSIVTTKGNALTLTNSIGDTDITFTDTYMSTITGNDTAIHAKNNGFGALSITTSGDVTGTNYSGIDAENSAAGTDLTIQVTSVAGGWEGIDAENDGSGALSITATGDVTGTNYSGIDAENSAAGTDLTIQVTSVAGGWVGIDAENDGSGALSITATGDVTGGYEGIDAENSAAGTDLTIQVASVTGYYEGIDAENFGNGALSITATGDVFGGYEGIDAENSKAGTDLTIQVASVSGGYEGIAADNFGSGALSITATGDVTGGSYQGGIEARNSVASTNLTIQAAASSGDAGIYAKNSGSGALSITATGDVVGTANHGIVARNYAAGTDLTVQAAAVSGYFSGIEAKNFGSGALSVTASGPVTGGDFYNGINAYNSAAGTDLTIQAATITGDYDGIEAENRGSGALSITATGTVTSTNRAGIDAEVRSPGTDLTIQVADVTAYNGGIEADNKGSGALSITATGTVTSADGIGIDAKVHSSGTDLTIQVADVTAYNDGIEADNEGSGALSITATGTVTSADGIGIDAKVHSSGTDLTIQVADVTAYNDGIEADNEGSGALSITATGTVTSADGIGIDAKVHSSGTDLTIQVADVTAYNDGIEADNKGSGALSITATGTVMSTIGDGIDADNEGSGALSVTATGAVTSLNGIGIDAISDSNGTDLTIQGADVTAYNDGIEADNKGSGALSITATGTVMSTVGDGIDADNSAAGTDLIIQVASVTGGDQGVSVNNKGSGATSITVSGAVIGGTGEGIDIFGADATLTLNSGGMVSATSGSAIRDSDGDATVIVNTGSAVTGTVQLGNGSDTVVLAGGDISGVTSFDGGDDSSVADGFIDTLRTTDTVALSGANVTNFERLEIADGSIFSLADNMLSIGDGTAATGVFVQSGGTWRFQAGTTTLTGAVSNSGTIAVPAGSELRVAGDTVFEAGGRFEVGIASDTDAGLLTGDGGAITFNDASEVYADVTSGIELTNAGEIRVATATGGVTDNGLSVSDNTILYEFSHEVRNAGKDLFLIVQRDFDVAVVTSNGNGGTNAESIAGAIDVFLDDAPVDNVILQYLSQFPLDQQEQELLALVQDTLPSESGADGASTVAAADLVMDLIMDRLSGGGFSVADSGGRKTGVAAGEQVLGGPGNWALWGRVGASTAEYDPAATNGFDSDTYAISIGIDGDLAQDLRMGLALFYASTGVDEIGVAANSNQDIEGSGVLFYGAYHPGDFYVDAMVGFGLNEYDSQRQAAGGVNTADYDGTQFMSRVELGKTFAEGAWDISPHVGLRYNQASIDGYTETGPLPTTIGSQSLTSLRGVLGLRARYTHEMEDGSKLIPEGYLRGLQELADPNGAITGSVVGGGSFISQTTERDKFSYAAGVGLTYEMDDQFSVRFMYDGEYQTDYQEHSLTAAIRYQF
ncbi:unnamed protein product [Effrenium voratum]|nr:unnamed protein product [Effrenium voratum]